MSGTGTRLTLVVPSLSGVGRMVPVPRLPALERLLVRGRREAAHSHSLEHHLATLFGLDADGELPVGALCRLGDGAAADGGWWFRAVPAHFFAARDRLRLASVEEVRAEESAALVDLFNAHFAADGWFLEATSPARWYLRAPGPQALRTRSFSEASESDLRGALPEGPDALHCHRFLNEVQMLFHGSPLNTEREARGGLAINGLWFWGGGEVPVLERRFEDVWSDDPLARGLGLASDAAVHALPERLPVCSASTLVMLTPDAEPAAWGAVEEMWFAPLERALREGRLEAVTIDSGTSFTVRVTRAEARRWWRLRRSLEQWS